MANERPLTLAEARKLLHRHTGDDPADLDGCFKARLNEALERINSEAIWDGMVERVDVAAAGYITAEVMTLPYAYESMLAVTVDDCPYPIMGKQLEFIQSGPGIEDAGDGGNVIIDLGFTDAAGSPVEHVRQYKFLMDIGAATEVEALLKKRFVYIENDTDTVVPSNIGALKHALLAVCFENEGDPERSAQYWDECFRLLQTEKQTAKAGVNEPNPQQQWGFYLNKPYSMV